MTDDATPSGRAHPQPGPDAADAPTVRQAPRAGSTDAPGDQVGGTAADATTPAWPYPPIGAGYPGAPLPEQAYAGSGYPDQAYPDQAYPAQAYPAQAYPDQQRGAVPPAGQYPPEGYPGQAYAGAPYPAQPGYPDQPPYPAQPGYPDQQQYAGQPYAGQPYAGQPYAGQPHAGQPHAGQPYAGQTLGRQEQRRNPLTVIAAVVTGLAAVSVIAVIGIVVSNRRHEQPDPAPTIATGSPTASTSGSPSGSASPGVSGSTVPASSTAASPSKTAATASGSEEPSIALSKGDCIKDLPQGRTITKVTLVSCTTAHAAQVGSTFSPAGSSYPGPKQYEALIAKECPTRLNKVVRSDAPSLSWAGYYPEILEWAHGDRSIKCLLIPSNKKPLTRSVVS